MTERTDDVVGRVLADGRIRSEAEAQAVREAVAVWEHRHAPVCGRCGLPVTNLRNQPGLCGCEPAETGPAAYRRNLPSMAPAAPPAGGLADTSATGPRGIR